MILNMYGDMVFSVFTVFTLCMFVVGFFIKQRPAMSWPQGFFVMMILFVVVRALRLSSEHHFPLGVLMMMVFFGFYYSGLKRELFIKCYQKIGFILCCVLILQFIQLLLFGTSFSGLFTFLPLNIGAGGDAFDSERYISSIAEEQRCNSLFAEPSHFAQFIMPLIAIDLFYAKDKKHLIRSAFWVVCALMSKSGMAILGLGIIGIAYGVYYLKTHKFYQNIVTILFLAVPISLAFAYILRTVYISEFLERAGEFSGDNENVSGYVRVVRGFVVYENMSLVQKLTGISGNALQGVIGASGLLASFSRDSGIYFNLVQNMLIGDGLFVFSAFVVFIFKVFRKSGFAGKTILSVFVLYSLMESMYFTPVFQLYIMSVILLTGKEKFKNIVVF